MTTPRTGKAADALAGRLREEGVKYCLASYVDLHGIPKCKAVPIAHLDRMLGGSEMFTGAALDGVPQQVHEDEVCAVPDPESVTVLPWNRQVAWFASDLYFHGAPFEACSRAILKRVLARAAEMGFRFNLGIETEFCILRRTDDGGFAVVSDRDALDKPGTSDPALHEPQHGSDVCGNDRPVWRRQDDRVHGGRADHG